MPSGTRFVFYLDYTYTFSSDNSTQTRQITQHLRSDQVPVFNGQYYQNRTWNNYYSKEYPEYGGASTLLYSADYTDPDTNQEEEVMMIGFEDAFGLDGENETDNYYDKDFNDVVLLILGDLPEPSSKRFFAEDLTSFDYDYNDVVFDVMNTGITLRAVGGTLPVYLEVTDKGGNTETYGELHDLMWSMQTDEEKRKHPVKTYERNGKTYYKPIRAGAEPGLAIEAVQLVTWHYGDMAHAGQGLALTDDELVRFANPKAAIPVGGVKLIVGKVVGDEVVVTENGQTAAEDASFHVIEQYQGVAPAIWSGPSSIRWAKEMVKITKAYLGFCGSGTSTEQTGGIPMWWTEVNLGNTYQFSGDEDPDRDNTPYEGD